MILLFSLLWMPMENIDSLLRLIRIDWEDTQSHSFNPLPLALQLRDNNSAMADDFKNTYHKIEKCMQNIIETSFKGFSDSILSYKKCSSNVDDNLNKLSDINLTIDEIKKSTHVDVNLLNKQKALIKNQEELLGRLELLKDLRDSIEERNINNVEDASYNILHCMALYKQCADLKPVRLVHHDIDRKKNEVMDRISKGIIAYTFNNKGQILFNVKSIFILEIYAILDKNLILPARASLISNIQSKIRESDESDYHGDEKLKVLARSLNSYFVAIMGKYEDLLKKIKVYMKKGDNFFEKDYVATGFFKKSVFIDLLKREVFKLIGSYTVHTKEHTFEKFVLDEIEEVPSIGKLLDKKVNLGFTAQNKQDSELKQTGYEISTEGGIDFIFYLYEDIFEDFKHDLYKFLKENYFLKKEKKIGEKVDHIFESKFLKVENKKSALASRIQKIVTENDYYGLDFGLSNFITIFNSVINGFNDNHESLYKSKIYILLFREDHKVDLENENAQYDKYLNILKEHLKNKRIDTGDCFTVDKNRDIGYYLIESIRDIQKIFMKSRLKYESVEPLPELKEIEMSLNNIFDKYEISFRFQFIIDILYLFDHFYRSGRFGNKDPYFKDIVKIIQNLYNLNHEGDLDLYGLFDSLEYYILNNVNRLNVNDKNGLFLFIEDLKTIEEIVSNFEMKYENGFENILTFYNSVLANELDTPEKKEFAAKISLNKS